MPMKSTDKVFPLRLSVTMYAFFEEEAKKNRRSVNTEFLVAIENRQAEIKRQQDNRSQRK